MILGIGGAPEGVLAAAAVKCLGGDMQGRLVPENDEQSAAWKPWATLTSTRFTI